MNKPRKRGRKAANKRQNKEGEETPTFAEDTSGKKTAN